MVGTCPLLSLDPFLRYVGIGYILITSTLLKEVGEKFIAKFLKNKHNINLMIIYVNILILC